MIEALEFWNEPNNLSHWDYEADPHWREFARMIIAAAARSRALAPHLRRVLGGICPIDPSFIRLMNEHGVMHEMNAVGVHGFPLDWDRWPIDEWPDRLAEVEAVTSLPVWVTEVGTSNVDADLLQVFGLRRTAQLLSRLERTFWYSLLDLPCAWPATIAPYEVRSGSSYRRHYHMGLVAADGTPKPAARTFPPPMGICQWFHWHDPRLHQAVSWLRRLGVRRLRTCISWADWHRPCPLPWFDRLMSMLDDFDLTLILCFTPPSRGVCGTTTSPPADYGEFVWFCEEVIRRYVLREGWSPLKTLDARSARVAARLPSAIIEDVAVSYSASRCAPGMKLSGIEQDASLASRASK